MPKCVFRGDYELHGIKTTFQCDESALPSGYCIFHDNSFSNNEIKRKRLEQKFNEAGSLNRELILVGYNIPSFQPPLLPELTLVKDSTIENLDWTHQTIHNFDFVNVTFQNKFDCSHARLQNVSFSNVTFNDVSFHEATLKECMIENSTIKKFYCVRAIIEKLRLHETQFKKANFDWADLIKLFFTDTIFTEVHFSGSMIESSRFLSSTFDNAKFLYVRFEGENTFIESTFNQAEFTGSNFKGEIDFSNIHLPEFKEGSKEIPIEFNYVTFGKRAKFIGTVKHNLNLESVSFIGTDLTNVEFHNVKWLQTKNYPWRKIIPNETLLPSIKNFEEVSKVYNQLRKNYEAKLLFNEASNFFIGEMETIRRGLVSGNWHERCSSIPYFLYKYLAFYGESYTVPLLIWTPVLVFGFAYLRGYFTICSQPVEECTLFENLADSFAANFALPRSENFLDILQRVVSIPILGTAFIALKRKFERRK
ncbi:MAG: pentapeptide repeat-containing protein [Thermoproteota archaeon]